MNNPWEEISLSDYENHMSLESVNQLQTMNSLMKKQFSGYPVRTAMVLGIAGGNGLEHVRSGELEKVYGIDINEGYLKTVEERYKDLAGSDVNGDSLVDERCDAGVCHCFCQLGAGII